MQENTANGLISAPNEEQEARNARTNDHANNVQDAATSEILASPMDTEETRDTKPSKGYIQLPVFSASSLVALPSLPTSVVAIPFSFAFSTPTIQDPVSAASVTITFDILTAGISSLRKPALQATAF